MHRFTTPKRVLKHETHVSTQRHPAQAHAWFSCPHGDQGWSSGTECPSRQGSSSPDAVKLADHAYPRSSRLVRPAEFTRVYREGRRIAGGSLQIIYRTGESTRPRLGLAVPKRILPRAVDRNRVKRLIRESFRRHRAQLPPLDLVVALRGRKQRGTPADLTAVLEALWQRLPTG